MRLGASFRGLCAGAAPHPALTPPARGAVVSPDEPIGSACVKIALMTHIRHPLRPPFMGGMEAHGWHLARELAARGHEVTLFASGDSAPPPGVRLYAVLEEHYDRRYPWHDFHGTDTLNDLLDAGGEGAIPLVSTDHHGVDPREQRDHLRKPVPIERGGDHHSRRPSSLRTGSDPGR